MDFSKAYCPTYCLYLSTTGRIYISDMEGGTGTPCGIDGTPVGYASGNYAPDCDAMECVRNGDWAL